MPTIGTRLTRSASQPIGTAPSTKNADDAVPMNTTAPSADVERVAEFGAEHLHRVRSSWSNAISSPRTTNMSLPPLANASAKVTGSEFDARQQVVGEDDLLRRRGLRLLARRLLVEHGGGERRGVAAWDSPGSTVSCRARSAPA